MIFAVHTLYFVFRYAIKLYRKHRAFKKFLEEKEELLRLSALEKVIDCEESIVFDPPLYIQRYAEVQQVLLDCRWRKDVKKVVEFGCAELNFFKYLKHLFGITEILEVDIDEALLKQHSYRLQPMTADYLNQRTDPLIVKLLCGSIGDPDYRLENTDAVVAIEIIEHLYPDNLDALTYNIFNYMKPCVAVFTTPNAEFNVLFPDFKNFRHFDHKFEWTRAQFEEWAANISVRYPHYSVSFKGIGKGPKGYDHLGCCSQMAIFVKDQKVEVPKCLRRNMKTRVHSKHLESVGICTYYSYSIHLKEFENVKSDDESCDKENNYYKLVEAVNYPYTVDNRSSEEKILHEAQYFIYRSANVYSRYFNEDTNMVEIPLYEVIKNFKTHFTTVEEISKLLVAADFTVRECCLHGSETELCVIYDINMDGKSSTADSDAEKTEPEFIVNATSIGDDSDWDLMDDSKEKKDEAETSDQLFDSGYQKSNTEWSPQSPIAYGIFEEQFYSTLALDVNDIKDKAIKKAEGKMQMNNKVMTETQAKLPSSSIGPWKEDEYPGTSDSKKRKKLRKSEGDEDSLKDEVKTITQCILYNSLNKLDIEEDVPQIAQVVIPNIPVVVENGDLANNNRDNEGNNYEEAPVNDNLMDNLDNIANQDQENQNDVANLPIVDYEEEEQSEAAAEVNLIESDSLNHASREALFDPNSQLDMLEEYALPADDDIDDSEPVLHSVRSIPEEEAIAVPEVVDPFPHWLLQMLDLHADEGENHDEPHFFCQGDGLGVHPSIVEVDADDTTSSDTSSSDDAQAEHAISEEDVRSLPADGNNPDADALGLHIVGRSIQQAASVASSNDSADEFFDTVDVVSDNCPPRAPDE